MRRPGARKSGVVSVQRMCRVKCVSTVDCSKCVHRGGPRDAPFSNFITATRGDNHTSRQVKRHWRGDLAAASAPTTRTLVRSETFKDVQPCLLREDALKCSLTCMLTYVAPPKSSPSTGPRSKARQWLNHEQSAWLVE